MRTVEEIEVDIARWKKTTNRAQTEMLRLLHLERIQAVTDGIPDDRLRAICEAERDGRVFTVDSKEKLKKIDAVLHPCGGCGSTEAEIEHYTTHTDVYCDKCNTQTVYCIPEDESNFTRPEAEAALRKGESP